MALSLAGAIEWVTGWRPGAAEVKSGLPAGGPVAPDTILGGWFGGVSKAGTPVNWKTAIEATAVHACARVIAEGLAQVPCKLMRLNSSGGRVEARDHPLFPVLYRQPNSLQSSFEWREQMGYHLALAGNAFNVVLRDVRGRVTEILPFEPGHVRLQYYQDHSVRYWVRREGGTEFEVPAKSMWHIRGPSWNGYMGMDAVRLARNAIGLAIAAEEFGSEMFANGSRPSGILVADGAIGPEQSARIKEDWEAVTRGAGNRMRTALLSGGLKWQQVSVNADEAQWIETRRFQVEEVCRAFRVNPVMVQHHMNNMAYASVEQLFLQHVTHTLGPWFERFEQSAETNLLSAAERAAGMEIELVDQSLTRGTAHDRAQTLAVLRQNGAITGNEFRQAMDLPPQSDPTLSTYEPAANLFGNRATAE